MLILEKARTRAHEKTIGEFTKEISNSIMDSKNDDKKYIETLIQIYKKFVKPHAAEI